MGRVSTREDKSVYQLCREERGLSREKAAEVVGSISASRIEKIERGAAEGGSEPHPDEVLALAEGYNAPHLCNWYCSRQCPIGKRYVPEVELKELPQIALETLASLNAARRWQERLIEMAADGSVSADELPDFASIQRDLERVSVAVETLQIWAERTLEDRG